MPHLNFFPKKPTTIISFAIGLQMLFFLCNAMDVSGQVMLNDTDSSTGIDVNGTISQDEPSSSDSLSLDFFGWLLANLGIMLFYPIFKAVVSTSWGASPFLFSLWDIGEKLAALRRTAQPTEEMTQLITLPIANAAVLPEQTTVIRLDEINCYQNEATLKKYSTYSALGWAVLSGLTGILAVALSNEEPEAATIALLCVSTVFSLATCNAVGNNSNENQKISLINLSHFAFKHTTRDAALTYLNGIQLLKPDAELPMPENGDVPTLNLKFIRGGYCIP